MYPKVQVPVYIVAQMTTGFPLSVSFDPDVLKKTQEVMGNVAVYGPILLTYNQSDIDNMQKNLDEEK